MSASPPQEAPATHEVAEVGPEVTTETAATEPVPEESVNEPEANQNEDQEEEAPRPRLAFPPRETPAESTTLQPTVHAEEDEDSDEDGLADLVAADEAASASGSGSGSDNDEEEAYVPATESSAAKIPSFKKNKKGKKARTDGQEIGTNGEKRGKKSKKSEEVVRDDGDDEIEDDGPLLDEGTCALHHHRHRFIKVQVH